MIRAMISFMSGFREFRGEDLNQNFSLVGAMNSVETDITAHAGGTQAAAYQLSKLLNVVTIVATNDDSVKLPSSLRMTPGQEVWIENRDASQNIKVFGEGTDTINGIATATGIAQAALTTAVYKFIGRSTAGVGDWTQLLGA